MTCLAAARTLLGVLFVATAASVGTSLPRLIYAGMFLSCVNATVSAKIQGKHAMGHEDEYLVMFRENSLRSARTSQFRFGSLGKILSLLGNPVGNSLLHSLALERNGHLQTWEFGSFSAVHLRLNRQSVRVIFFAFRKLSYSAAGLRSVWPITPMSPLFQRTVRQKSPPIPSATAKN